MLKQQSTQYVVLRMLVFIPLEYHKSVLMNNSAPDYLGNLFFNMNTNSSVYSLRSFTKREICLFQDKILILWK